MGLLLPALLAAQQFVYLIQSSAPRTEPRLLPHENRDVLYLCFARNCNVSGVPAQDVLVNEDCSWTQGRNILLEEAIRRTKLRRDAGYLYYIFLDEDMTDVILGENPWGEFEGFLAAYEPAVGYITDAAEWHIHHDRRDDGPITRGRFFNVDANCNAMHRRTLGLLLPYETALDEEGIFFSSVITSYLTSMLFASHRLGLNTIRANHSHNQHNTNHGGYKRSHDWDIALTYVDHLFTASEHTPLEAELERGSVILRRNAFIDCNYAWCEDGTAGGPKASVVTTEWIRKHMNLQHNITKNLLNFHDRHHGWLLRLRGEYDFAPSIARLVCQDNAASSTNVGNKVVPGGTPRAGWCNMSDKLWARWCRNYQHPLPRLVSKFQSGSGANWQEQMGELQWCHFRIPHDSAGSSLAFEAAVRGLTVGVEYVLTLVVTRELGFLYGDGSHPHLQRMRDGTGNGSATPMQELVVFEEETRMLWSSDREERAGDGVHCFTCTIPPLPQAHVHHVHFVVTDTFPGGFHDKATGRFHNFAIMTNVMCSSMAHSVKPVAGRKSAGFGALEDLKYVCEACVEQQVEQQGKPLVNAGDQGVADINRRAMGSDLAEELKREEEVIGGSAQQRSARPCGSDKHDTCSDEARDQSYGQSLGNGYNGVNSGHGDEHQTVSIRHGSLGRVRRPDARLNASFAVVGLVPAFDYSLSVKAVVRRANDGCNQEPCDRSLVIEQRHHHVLTPSQRASGAIDVELAIPNPHRASGNDVIIVEAQIVDMFPGLSEDEMVLGVRTWRFPHPKFEFDVTAR